jgi:hypothetical protein
MRDPHLVARVSGYSYAQEYDLDWTTHTATFKGQVCNEAHSLSLPTINARREGDTLTILGMPPLRGAQFVVQGPEYDWRTSDRPIDAAHRAAFEKEQGQ